MAYTSLVLNNFRSYGEFQVDFSPGVNIIVGPNGSGKTNLLEALYVLSQGTSFRVGDKDLLQYEAPWFRIQGVHESGQRTIAYDRTKQPPKQFTLDGVKKQRLGYAQKVPLVLFEPNELRVLNGAPQRRREYLDSLVSRLWADGSVRRSRFERALLQRNNIIRQAGERSLEVVEDHLFVWDIKLAEYGAALVEYRLAVIAEWNKQLAELYSTIAGVSTSVKVLYKSDDDVENYKASLLWYLTARRHTDIAKGFTSVGPQRDDIVVLINGADAAVSASRGELRTLVLALKVIELNSLHSLHDKRPLLLLDDVFSELDVVRRKALAQLARDFQTVITTTDADLIADYFTKEYKLIKLDKYTLIS